MYPIVLDMYHFFFIFDLSFINNGVIHKITENMLLHYFKIAFRNHLRHKTQSLITLFSLAISFAFVALAAYWNHYEQTYDSFMSNYERIYLIGSKNLERGTSGVSYFELHTHLMDNYPEVEKACGVLGGWTDDSMVEIDGCIVQAGCEKITPGAVDVFGIQWVEGKRNMESWNENEVAISEKIARQVCGMESPIGKKLVTIADDGITTKDEYRIAAVFKTWPQHSNFNFHVLQKLRPRVNRLTPCYTYVCLHPDADPNVFLYRLKNDKVMNPLGSASTYNQMFPLNEVHYTFLRGGKQNLSLDDVKLFTGATILLSVCALLNYLTLFVSRLRNRGRDMALRAICGSSSWQTGALLMVEYLLLMFGSLLLGLMFVELFYSGFVELSQLKVDRVAVYAGCGYLLLFIFGLSALLSLVPILFFKNKTLRVQIDSMPTRMGRSRFRIAGVCMQLFISLLFIFCSTIMIKQIHFLIHANINIERKNVAWIDSYIGDGAIMDILRQIPSVTEMVPLHTPLFPSFNAGKHTFRGMTGGEYAEVTAWHFYVNQDIANFYGLRMKEGQQSFDLKPGEYLINETFANQLGDVNPIGKVLRVNKHIKGIVRGIFYDFQYQPPTSPDRAIYLEREQQSFYDNDSHFVKINTVAFKYTGDFADCQAAIKKAFENVEVPSQIYKNRLEDGETVYRSYLKHEFNLLKLINILTVISVLIALFGVYAQILQECERQRKNIAIRKVFGAQVKDILMMFFKEYLQQVALAAVLAFPIGYVLMKNWLRDYSCQTSIGIEVFLGIFIGMALLVMLCIGWHVWRAANENPATAVKKE